MNLGEDVIDVIQRRAKSYKKEGSDYLCPNCGATIMATTAYVSIHEALFSNTHAGYGGVEKIEFPYCPNCDEKAENVSGCVHR